MGILIEHDRIRHLKQSSIRLCFALVCLSTIAGASAMAADPTTTETIVMLRHGEKPASGLGQLNCQGLNRSLALPAVIAREFARPAAIFAPDPAQEKVDSGQTYSYIRPLATIEPTAIALGLPVDATIGFSDIAKLQQRLQSAALNNSLVLVSWEHSEIVDLTKLLLSTNGGNADSVPNWKSSDFDSMYVVTISRTGEQVTASFTRKAENLNNQPAKCPG